MIRTSDIPLAQRHDAWRSVVCDTLGPLELRSDPDTPLRGEIAAGQLGPVSVGRMETSTPHSAHRTAGLIRRDSLELYRVALAMSGQACLLPPSCSSTCRSRTWTVIISEHTQVMLLTEAAFASCARTGVADATAATEVILVLGVEIREQVDELASKAETAGGSPVGAPKKDGYRYQRGFTDLDGHRWEALCLVQPAS